MENRKSITYGLEDIKRYKQGLMSREEMHAFEKASMEDPFLSDALEGYMQADMNVAEDHLGNIRERITDKEDEKEQAVVVPMQCRSYGMWRVAAMVILIAGAGLVTYKVLDNKKANDNAEGQIAKINPGKIDQVYPKQNSEGNQSPAVLPSDSNTTAGNTIASRTDTATYRGLTVTTSTFASTKPRKVSAKQTAKFDYTQANNSKDAALRDAVSENKDSVALAEVTTAAPTPRAETASMSKARANNNGYVNEFRGTIVTPSNEPLANASLQVQNSNKKVFTDNNGNFALSAKDTLVNATITNGTYKNTTVQLRANTTNNINLGTIQMKQDEALEKTIAVVNLGSKKAVNADAANNKPVGGWETFRAYVSKELGIDINDSTQSGGYVNSTQIEFAVGSNGKVKDIKVINTTDEVKAKQIIEAIKNGPKWANKNKTRLVINY